MFFADFSVNSQPILMTVTFSSKNIIGPTVQKLDHLTCSKFVITTSLYKPIKLVKLKFSLSPELYYMPDGLIS